MDSLLRELPVSLRAIFSLGTASVVAFPLLCGGVFAWHFHSEAAKLNENIPFKVCISILAIFTFSACVVADWMVRPINDDGAEVALGNNRSFPGYHGLNYFYCGRSFPLPGSDGRCGPAAGPQCASCTRFQVKHETNKFYIVELDRVLRPCWWLSPTISMIVFFLLFGAQERSIECSSDMWTPIIPQLASLYLPAPGSSADDAIKDALLKISTFLPFGEPDQLLPLLNQQIQSKTGRTTYFVAEMLLATFLTCMLLEVVRWCCRSQSSSPDSYHQLAASGSAPSERSLSAAPFKSLIYRVAFGCFYIIYHLVFYVIMDYAVSRGFLSLVTGMVWELWVAFTEIICMMAICTGIPWYVSNRGVTQEHPTPLVMMQMLPWLGNEVHIIKDFTAMALCFVVADCKDGMHRAVALVLGYMSLAATFAPVVLLFTDKSALTGLRQSHWPIPEMARLRKTAKKLSRQEKAQRKITETSIGAVTPDKYMRAIVGEIPHAILHFSFAYYFGGSPFIVVAIVMSVAKVLCIPIGRLLLQSRIPENGCSESSLERFLGFCPKLKWSSSDNAIRKAIKYEWYEVLDLIRGFWPRFDDIDFDDINEGSSDEDSSILSKILCRDPAGLAENDVDHHMSILRILHTKLGICDKDWVPITVVKVLMDELPLQICEYLDEIEKMTGRREAAACIFQYVTGEDTEQEKALLAVAQRLNTMKKGQGSPDSRVSGNSFTKSGSRGLDDDEIESMYYAHAQRVRFGLLFLAMTVPLLIGLVLQLFTK